MTRIILLIVSSCIALSCNQSAKPANDLTSDESTRTVKAVPADSTEIDFAVVSPSQAKVLLENEYVRVIEYSLKPGEKDTPHTHPPKSSYVISGGMLRVYPEGGEPFDAEEVKGMTEWSGRVGKHYVENIGSTTVTILLTEVKAAR
ncbi:MAG: hypothetical protein JNL40_02045 [Cyclobacteriaceae bacterium]|nr:hypothetical protein [Cyclobacteriaceae bacterium]